MGGGQAHPVWWDELVRWRVLLGGNLRGEVRIRDAGVQSPKGSKLQRLRDIARTYDCTMNIYTSNCRIFAARMQREVERLNAEDATDFEANFTNVDEIIADARLAFAIFNAG